MPLREEPVLAGCSKDGFFCRFFTKLSSQFPHVMGAACVSPIVRRKTRRFRDASVPEAQAEFGFKIEP